MHSKTIQAWVDNNPGKATEYYHDPDGHWVYLKNGWQSPSAGCGTIREDTVKEVMVELKNIVTGDYF